MTVKAQTRKANEFIEKGGDVKKEPKTKRENWTQISLYLPPEYLRGISESIKELGYISRNCWILQSINEKLENDIRTFL